MVNSTIKNRKSIRNYNPKGIVTDDQIKELLEAAMLAPSARNMRPWEFIAVTKREILDEMANFNPSAQMLKTAAAAIVVVGLPDLQKGLPIDGMWTQDCSAVTENILLQATDLGLGTCWCGIFPKANLVNLMQSLFEIPNNKIPFCVIAIGEPNERFGGRGFYEETKVKWVR
jgi:nitroreductase